MPPGGPLFSRNDDKERVRDATDIVRIVGKRRSLSSPKAASLQASAPSMTTTTLR